MGTIKTGFWKINFILTPGEFKELLNSCVQKGKYFIYEDIRVHQPTIYQIFENLASEIKRITKRLRFEAQGIDGYEQLKPPIRISEQAAHEVKEGWLFKACQLQMKSYH